MVFHQFKSMIGNVQDNNMAERAANLDGEREGDNAKAEKKFLSNLEKHMNRAQEELYHPAEKAANLHRVAGFGVGVGSLYLQEALGYPFIVLQRQCQVNHTAWKYHVLPFTLFPVINKMYQRQAIGAFWKGWGSACIVQGLNIGTEILIFELFHVQRETEQKETTTKSLIIHEVLKGCSLLVTLPFFSASLIDTVQTLVLGEPRSVLTFCKDAFYRMIGWYTSRGHGRLISFYSLVVPSILYGILRYSIKVFLSSLILKMNSQQNKNKKDTDMKNMYFIELSSNFLSSLVTDVVMFPLETVFLRLHLQGTRTIIDDTDKGYGVVPLCTSYDGIKDCFYGIHRKEGIAGFYKGFGALCLQYFVRFLILRGAKLFYSD